MGHFFLRNINVGSRRCRSNTALQDQRCSASLPLPVSSAAQCSLAHNRILMTGHEHDEIIYQCHLSHHHLHISTLTRGVKGQRVYTAQDLMELRDRSQLHSPCLGFLYGSLCAVTLCQNLLKPTVCRKSDHHAHAGPNMQTQTVVFQHNIIF